MRLTLLGFGWFRSITVPSTTGACVEWKICSLCDLLSLCCHLRVHCQQTLRIICQYGGVDGRKI
jgi:hypothetical protein